MIIDKISKDTNKIQVRDVAKIFATIMTRYHNDTESGGALKRKLTHREYVKYVNGLTLSFLGTIYANAAKNEKELAERTKEFMDENKDVGMYVSEIAEA